MTEKQAEQPIRLSPPTRSLRKLIDMVVGVALKSGMTKMQIRDHVERALSVGGSVAVTTYSRTGDQHAEPEKPEA